MLIVLRYDSSPVKPRRRSSPHRASSDNSDISTELRLAVVVLVSPCFLHVLHRYERPSAALLFLLNSETGNVLPHTPHILVCSISSIMNLVTLIKFLLHTLGVCFPPPFVYQGFNTKVTLPDIACHPQQRPDDYTANSHEKVTHYMQSIACNTRYTSFYVL